MSPAACRAEPARWVASASQPVANDCVRPRWQYAMQQAAAVRWPAAASFRPRCSAAAARPR
eukprot:3965967-Lingulodinium_polyedra.AAC.1